MINGHARNFETSSSSAPWSLASTDGTIAKAVKSKLVELVKKNVANLDEEPRESQWILDAMALLQSITHIPDSFSNIFMTWKFMLLSLSNNVRILGRAFIQTSTARV